MRDQVVLDDRAVTTYGAVPQPKTRLTPHSEPLPYRRHSPPRRIWQPHSVQGGFRLTARPIAAASHPQPLPFKFARKVKGVVPGAVSGFAGPLTPAD